MLLLAARTRSGSGDGEHLLGDGERVRLRLDEDDELDDKLGEEVDECELDRGDGLEFTPPPATADGGDDAAVAVRSELTTVCRGAATSTTGAAS